jgi:hypothetical protein
MPQTTGFTGIGAELQIGDGATPTEVFNAVGNVTSINLNTEADQVDATHLLSTSGYREYKQGFKSASVDFEYHFDPDNPTHDDTDGMLAAYDSGESRNFKIDFTGADNSGVGAPTTNGVCSFSGVVTAHSVSVSEGMVTGSGTISMSSSPTWGAAS